MIVNLHSPLFCLSKKILGIKSNQLLVCVKKHCNDKKGKIIINVVGYYFDYYPEKELEAFLKKRWREGVILFLQCSLMYLTL